jgi:hypothetical protein
MKVEKPIRSCWPESRHKVEIAQKHGVFRRDSRSIERGLGIAIYTDNPLIGTSRNGVQDSLIHTAESSLPVERTTDGTPVNLFPVFLRCCPAVETVDSRQLVWDTASVKDK